MGKPKLALTMGDPAGIGPEITVKSLFDATVYEESQPLVVGDVAVLEEALRFSNLTATVHPVSHPDEGVYQAGTIDVLDLANVNVSTLKMGQVQAAGGKAAFEYIERAIRLAVAGEVNAVVTAPINKESLQAAKVPYIGHTEMFAELTGSKQEMTMFSILNLKIFLSHASCISETGMRAYHKGTRFLGD